MWEYNVDAGNNVAEIIVRKEMALPINYPQAAQGLSESKMSFLYLLIINEKVVNLLQVVQVRHLNQQPALFQVDGQNAVLR
ncbi:hypothetical protein SMKC082_21000 [Serratia marcescens]|nr:hypothetical protein SMKC082_21000 [Serratia marcescens]BEO47599.1 hypothetical protein SMQE20_21580 [Serratia marcescens]BEO66595.1 hypothetical protein SMQE31_21030 [Serratia marcescens]